METKISQFAKEVVNFSSQYGTQGTHTYTACNLAGKLNIYDGYGDRTEAFVLVSYCSFRFLIFTKTNSEHTAVGGRFARLLHES